MPLPELKAMPLLELKPLPLPELVAMPPRKFEAMLFPLVSLAGQFPELEQPLAPRPLALFQLLGQSRQSYPSSSCLTWIPSVMFREESSLSSSSKRPERNCPNL